MLRFLNRKDCYPTSTCMMLRQILRNKSVVLAAPALSRRTAVSRSFATFQALRNEDEHNHGHTHNGKPCAGHSHTHNGKPCSGHGHSHSHVDANGRPIKMDKPMLMLAFTCKKCDTRSSHVMSKQAYESGTIMVQCPGCKSRHLIADHLKIFSDNRIKLEDILKAQGEGIKTGTEDLVFEDIPDSLKGLIGHHAKNAPPEYQKKNEIPEETPKIASKDDN